MTTAEYLAAGQYLDFFSIDGTAYPLPLGFTLEPTPVVVENVKTMASGRKRRDLVRLSHKYKVTWSTATQDIADAAEAIFEASLSAAEVKLYLRKELPATPGDYLVSGIDLINPPKVKPKARPHGLFIYDVSLETE